ncbi:MAG: recombinase family protein [Candidatus Colwellbacteria bacterium]|nr:recombinase family protein [Candidatus Colwellbacteria bacterium]
MIFYWLLPLRGAVPEANPHGKSDWGTTAPFKFMKNEQNTTKNKAISFCRVSSKEQADEGYSLESQEKLLEAYATDDKRDFKIIKIYKITESASGKQVRKTFQEALKYATDQKIKIILCEKIDRLTRNLKDASTIDDWVKDKDTTGRQVHFVKENFILNADTKAHDNLVWDMKVAIARFYSNNLSEEVKKGQKEKIAQGWLPTKPPLGYRTIGDKGHKTHEIDEKIAPYIRKMFELYATGNYATARVKGLERVDCINCFRIHFITARCDGKARLLKQNTNPLFRKNCLTTFKKYLSGRSNIPCIGNTSLYLRRCCAAESAKALLRGKYKKIIGTLTVAITETASKKSMSGRKLSKNSFSHTLIELPR